MSRGPWGQWDHQPLARFAVAYLLACAAIVAVAAAGFILLALLLGLPF